MAYLDDCPEQYEGRRSGRVRQHRINGKADERSQRNEFACCRRQCAARGADPELRLVPRVEAKIRV